jgi:hypothetical protein
VKDAFILPKPKKVDLKTPQLKLNRRFHAITSKQYQEYLKKKEEDKVAKAAAVQERKKQRAEKKKATEEKMKVTENKKKMAPGNKKKLPVRRQLIADEEEHSDEVDNPEPWEEDSSDPESFSSLNDGADKNADTTYSQIEVGDFLLVKHQILKPKKLVYYIGVVLEKKEDPERYQMKFLRKS